MVNPAGLVFSKPRRWLLPLVLVCAPLIRAESSPASSAPQTESAYRLSATDLLKVEVFQEPELTMTSRVDGKGNIRLPLIGEVKVQGGTTEHAEATITRAYIDGEFLRAPHVTVVVVEHAPRQALITGCVRAPGSYALPIEASITLLDLIAKAGGLTDVARGGAVTLTRLGASGQKQTLTVDVTSLLRGKTSVSADTDMKVQPGDIVFVPERVL